MHINSTQYWAGDTEHQSWLSKHITVQLKPYHSRFRNKDVKGCGYAPQNSENSEPHEISKSSESSDPSETIELIKKKSKSLLEIVDLAKSANSKIQSVTNMTDISVWIWQNQAFLEDLHNLYYLSACKLARRIIVKIVLIYFGGKIWFEGFAPCKKLAFCNCASNSSDDSDDQEWGAT